MFDVVVQLYRRLGRPALNESNACMLRIKHDVEIIDLLTKCQTFSGKFGHFEFDEAEEEILTVDATFPKSEYRFFPNLDEFVAGSPALRCGTYSEGFYIVSEDYSVTDEYEPQCVINLRRAVEFVASLRKFSAVNIESEDNIDSNKLFFFRPADAKGSQKTVVVPVILTGEFSRFSIHKFRILDALTSANNSDHLHIEERRLILGIAIADVVKDHPADMKPLEYLARHWRDVVGRYRQDLIAYVSKFSFDAERKKIADAAIEYSTKVGTAFNEMTSKLLAAPISVAALLALYRIADQVEFFVACTSVFLAFLIYRMLLVNQVMQIKRINFAYKFMLESFQAKERTFPRAIQETISSLQADVKQQVKSTRRAILMYFVVAYVPILVMLIMMINKYDKIIFDYVWACLG